ncbi:MAG: two-component hybrid sensor and regulator [Myxococcales bacterium]|nr:two-component hybrid sensor and regulator [Myxococcales bacterium]
MKSYGNLEDVLTNATIGIAAFDRDLRFVRINEPLARMNGRSVADHLGKRLDEIDPGAHCTLADQIRAVMETGEPFETEVGLAPTGSERGVFEVRCFPVRRQDHQDETTIVGAVAIVVRITERRRKERERERRTQELDQAYVDMASLVANAPVGLVLFDRDLRYRKLNQALADMNGVPISAHIGKRMSEVVPGLPAAMETMLEEVFETGKPLEDQEIEGTTAARPGERRTWRASFFPVRRGDGTIVGVGKVSEDITEQKRALERLASASSQIELERQAAERAREAAECANRAKDEFLAMLGHELRNPLAPILTALELMRLREGQPIERERAVIERQARHMAQLVDDLLDMSRITGRKLELKRQPIEIAEVLAKAIETAAPLLEQRRHSLVTDVPARGLVVNGDLGRLIQVFSNLLTNAAKYSDPGARISVEARREGDELVVTVVDTGRGISAEMLPQIFDLFVQERQNLDRSRGGLGLGLAIVKSLVDLHGGHIEAFSEGCGTGSTFTVRLPAQTSTARAAEHESESSATRAKIPAGRGLVLVVDDNEDAAAMLAEMLDALGFTTRVASDGPKALAIAAKLTPDIALLDIGLPVMDGYELARRLREMPGWQRIPLIAVTGYGQESDKQLAREAGFDRHLVKPLDLPVLKQTLDEATTTPNVRDFRQRQSHSPN